ncbi:MAG: hypothetical protein R6V85_01465 [Polyangia bacterium]
MRDARRLMCVYDVQIAHRKAKARAALEGLSMSDFLLRELELILERPSRSDLLERIRSRPRVELPAGAAELVREERDSR